MPADLVRFEALEVVVVEALPQCFVAPFFRHVLAEDAQRLLDEAFGLWRGQPYGEFADTEFGAAEALRLEELRLLGHTLPP